MFRFKPRFFCFSASIHKNKNSFFWRVKWIMVWNTFFQPKSENRQQIKWNYEWSLRYLWNLFKYFIEKWNSIDVGSLSSIFSFLPSTRSTYNLMPFFSGTTSLMIHVIYCFWWFVTNLSCNNTSDTFMQISRTMMNIAWNWYFFVPHSDLILHSWSSCLFHLTDSTLTLFN